ncbi:MAG TPA: nitroreductase family protein [Desulfopila sp.]|nr:nitroreductase family protein [Desulfopila sp.]
MELKEAIRTRRSIRKFTGEAVPQEMIQLILEAAMLAPSAGNQQPWHFVVVTDRQKLDAIPEFHPYAAMLREVQVAIVVCGAPEGTKWPDFWVQDCSAAVQNMLLAARDLGLGSVWTGIYPLEDRVEKMRELFGIPAVVYPFAVVPLGWPDAEFSAKDRYRAAAVHRNRW